MSDTLHEDLCTFIIISRRIFLKINVSDKICIEIQNTHFTFIDFFYPENRVFNVIMWKSFVKTDRPQMTK